MPGWRIIFLSVTALLRALQVFGKITALSAVLLCKRRLYMHIFLHLIKGYNETGAMRTENRRAWI